MPQLNKLVSKYESRKDIIFLGLAIDNKIPLAEFLKKTSFRYQNVANQQGFMEKDLKVTGYPTHFIVDKTGKLFKVAYNANEVELFLQRILYK